MKLFNKKNKEKATEPKKENKILKFIKDHKVAIGYAALLCAAFAGGYISPNRHDYDPDDFTDLQSTDDDDEVILNKLKANGDEFGQPRYDVGIDDAFATVAYSDGDIGFVGKDYIMNLAERIVELRNEEEES